MKDNLIKTEMNVNNNKINVMRIGNEEYISLTDLARYADEDDPRYPIQNWMRNKDTPRQTMGGTDKPVFR